MIKPFEDEEIDTEQAPVSGSEELQSVMPEPPPTEESPIEMTLKERLLGRQKLDAEEVELARRPPSQVEIDAPLARGILGAQQGFANLLSNPQVASAGIRSAEGAISGMEKAEQNKRTSLREEIERRRKRLDEPVADLSLKNRLLGEARKERIGAATEGAEIAKPGLENAQKQQGLAKGELDIAKSGQDIEKGGMALADEKDRRDPKSPISVEARRRTAQAYRNEAEAFRRGGDKAGAARMEKNARDVENSDLPAEKLEETLKNLESRAAYGKDFMGDQRLRESSAASLAIRGEALEAKKNEKQTKMEMPSDKQTQTITDLDNIIQAAEDVKRGKVTVHTGPFAAFRNAVAREIGWDDPKVTAFRAQVGEQLADYVKSKTGAAASNQERAFLMDNIPNMSDNDETFTEKLRRFKMKAEQIRARTLQNIEAQGKNVSGFTSTETKKPEAPYGMRVERNGVNYIWNGTKYVREAK